MKGGFFCLSSGENVTELIREVCLWRGFLPGHLSVHPKLEVVYQLSLAQCCFSQFDVYLLWSFYFLVF